MSKVYINGTGCISPQNTIDKQWFFESLVPTQEDHFNAIEPSYKEFIAPNLLRRMGRAIKMGVAAGNIALQEANVTQVDAIITGTGLGCFEDSERFLLALVNNDEQFLTPTSFIQSTHNTVGAQIGLIMKCHAYNYTYVHRGFSFESTMIDALMLFKEGKQKILIGGIEEHTPTYVQLIRKANKLKAPPYPIWTSTSKGVQLSEGSTFFVLENQRTNSTLACLLDVQTLYKPKTSTDVLEKLHLFLKSHQLDISQIDVCVMGFSGDVDFDKILQELLPTIKQSSSVVTFKNACGEYHTASAFALYTASKIIKHQIIPDTLAIENKNPTEIKYALIINQYLGINYSFTLLSNC